MNQMGEYKTMRNTGAGSYSHRRDHPGVRADCGIVAIVNGAAAEAKSTSFLKRGRHDSKHHKTQKLAVRFILYLCLLAYFMFFPELRADGCGQGRLQTWFPLRRFCRFIRYRGTVGLWAF